MFSSVLEVTKDSWFVDHFLFHFCNLFSVVCTLTIRFSVGCMEHLASRFSFVSEALPILFCPCTSGVTEVYNFGLLLIYVSAVYLFLCNQAMCKVSDGENAFAKIGEALDNLNIRGTGFGSSILGIRRIPPDSGQANSACQDNSTSGRFDPATTNVPGPRLPSGRESETQFPSELISSCVATILMIQVNKP
jgi:hypothetical protein